MDPNREEVGSTGRKDSAAALLRKSNKPLMEKRRRERINNCLDQLKSILMEVTKKESSYYSKLEKADILEMTVKYLKNLKRQHGGETGSDADALSKYVAGFNECAKEVTQYLETVDASVGQDARTCLLGHLADSLQRGATRTPIGVSVSAFQTSTMRQPPPRSPASVDLPATRFSPMTSPRLLEIRPRSISSSLGSDQLAVSTSGTPSTLPPTTLMSAGSGPMRVVPARLANGDVVFILAGSTQSSTEQVADGGRVPESFVAVPMVVDNDANPSSTSVGVVADVVQTAAHPLQLFHPPPWFDAFRAQLAADSSASNKQLQPQQRHLAKAIDDTDRLDRKPLVAEADETLATSTSGFDAAEEDRPPKLRSNSDELRSAALLSDEDLANNNSEINDNNNNDNDNDMWRPW